MGKPKKKAYNSKAEPQYKWRVFFDSDKGRVARKFKTKKEADGFLLEKENEFENLGATKAAALDDRVKEEAFKAVEILKPYGVSLVQVAEQYRDKVEADKKKVDIKLRVAIDKFLKSKNSRDLRDRTLSSLKARLYNFAQGREETIVADVTERDCHDWIFQKGTARTKINRRLALTGFFKWAERKRLFDENPMAGITPPKADQAKPEILTIPQCQNLLQAASGHRQGAWLAYHVLGLFAGLRPAELNRLTWDDIDLGQKGIRIQGKAAKLRQNRWVPLSDNALDWLEPLALERPPIAPPGFQKNLQAIRQAAGIDPWPQDAMRHTCLSAWYGLTSSEEKTAKWAGNSPEIFHANYKGLMTDAGVKAFWAITPQSLETGNVVEFKEVANG